MSDLLDAAVSYAEHGFKVFPAKVIVNEDGKPVKQPLIKHGHKNASSDPAVVRRMFSRSDATLIGMVHDRFLVVDVDVKHGQPGLATYRNIEHRLPRALAKVVTASGGFHLYYPMPTDSSKGRDTKSLPGVDILWGPIGWVVVPPSEGYSWEFGSIDTIVEGLG